MSRRSFETPGGAYFCDDELSHLQLNCIGHSDDLPGGGKDDDSSAEFPEEAKPVLALTEQDLSSHQGSPSDTRTRIRERLQAHIYDLRESDPAEQLEALIIRPDQIEAVTEFHSSPSCPSHSVALDQIKAILGNDFAERQFDPDVVLACYPPGLFASPERRGRELDTLSDESRYVTHVQLLAQGSLSWSRRFFRHSPLYGAVEGFGPEVLRRLPRAPRRIEELYPRFPVSGEAAFRDNDPFDAMRAWAIFAAIETGTYRSWETGSGRSRSREALVPAWVATDLTFKFAAEHPAYQLPLPLKPLRKGVAVSLFLLGYPINGSADEKLLFVRVHKETVRQYIYSWLALLMPDKAARGAVPLYDAEKGIFANCVQEDALTFDLQILAKTFDLWDEFGPLLDAFISYRIVQHHLNTLVSPSRTKDPEIKKLDIYQMIAEYFVAHNGRLPKKVFSVGAGSGTLENFLTHRQLLDSDGEGIVGVDLCEGETGTDFHTFHGFKMVYIGTRGLTSEGLREEVISHCPDQVDLILFLDVLHEMQQPTRYVIELVRKKLAANGLMIVVDPLAGSVLDIISILSTMRTDFTRFLKSFYHLEDLYDLFTTLYFMGLDISPVRILPHTAAGHVDTYGRVLAAVCRSSDPVPRPYEMPRQTDIPWGQKLLGGSDYFQVWPLSRLELSIEQHHARGEQVPDLDTIFRLLSGFITVLSVPPQTITFKDARFSFLQALLSLYEKALYCRQPVGSERKPVIRPPVQPPKRPQFSVQELEHFKHYGYKPVEQSVVNRYLRKVSVLPYFDLSVRPTSGYRTMVRELADFKRDADTVVGIKIMLQTLFGIDLDLGDSESWTYLNSSGSPHRGPRGA